MAELLEDNDGLRTPDGYQKVSIEAYTDGEKIIITDQKGMKLVSKEDEDDFSWEKSHNCDMMGCSTLSHVFMRIEVPYEVEFTLE